MRLQELIDRLRAVLDERGDMYVMIAPIYGQDQIRPASGIEVLFPQSTTVHMVVIK